ncbi:MAG: hypothetical protein LBD58_02470 [Treponema sp.]|nr:hypothetical protein [Treponema sp.]
MIMITAATVTFVGCSTFEEAQAPIENPEKYLEKESVAINKKNIIMGEYTLEWKEKIHNTTTVGDNYHEIRGAGLFYIEIISCYIKSKIFLQKKVI